jgi:hypothetical protein
MYVLLKYFTRLPPGPFEMMMQQSLHLRAEASPQEPRFPAVVLAMLLPRPALTASTTIKQNTKDPYLLCLKIVKSAISGCHVQNEQSKSSTYREYDKFVLNRAITTKATQGDSQISNSLHM